jgi:predicted O-methyltransferase YrrM
MISIDLNKDLKPPEVLDLIEAETKAIGFSMGSERLTGALLRALAASKPKAKILELGTGTGISAAWLLDGMDEESHLTTVDNDAANVEIAKRHLGPDRRVTFHIEDGREFLSRIQDERFDLIFTDAWPGKFEGLELALSVLKVGGFYVIDDLLPQPNWPEDHAPKVRKLVDTLAQRTDLLICPMSWSSGLLVAVKKRSLTERAL